MKRSSSFITLPGLILTAIFLAGLGLFSWIKGGLAFAPGRLSAQALLDQPLGGYSSHQDFEGRCSLCHAPLSTSQEQLCLACHNQVQAERQAGQGTHSLVDPEQPCYACHSEHQGAQFDLRQPGLARFDHNLTRFSLVWHQIGYDAQPMDCQDCHAAQGDFTLQAEQCAACHAGHDPLFMQQHSADYGADCLGCHDGSDRMTGFVHDQTGFPLQGQHAQAACRACHKPPAGAEAQTSPADFGGLPVECQACHAEPPAHQGLFSNDCAACHTPEGWQPAKWQDQPFEHAASSGFSLARHSQTSDGAALICRDCHLDQVELPVETACRDCHTQTNGAAFIQEHQEQFGAVCLDCHDGLDRMSDFEHDRVFLLDGAHSQAACQDCHLERRFQGTPKQCVDCHAEPEIHAGFFGQQCQDCHTTQAWTPAQLRNHRFPLDHGGQGLQTCQTCHPNTYVEYTCYGCHEHQPAEMQEEHREEAISLAELANCAACHPGGQKDD